MPLGALTFRSRYGKAEPADLPSGVELRGEVEWFATGDESEVDVLLASVGSLGAKVSNGSALLRFGNAVGIYEIGSLGRLNVRCGKFTENVFDDLLHDVTQKVMSLPFSAAQSARVPHDRSIADRVDILLHTFVYVRQALLTPRADRSLAGGLASVLRDPHRRFDSVRAHTDLAIASRIDSRTIFQLAAGAGELSRAPVPLSQHALVRALRGHLPRYVDIPRVRNTFDTAENRFVLEVMKQVRAIIGRVDQLARARTSRSVFWNGALADCERMRRVIDPIERNALWQEVGVMDHVPFGSSVLQRRRGYKDVLRHYLMLRASARIPFDQKAVEESLLGLKDVASLYELWCYFQVVDCVEQEVGRPPDRAESYKIDIEQIDIPQSFAVAWDGGPTVHYNLTFNRRNIDPQKLDERTRNRLSSSLMLRPDIAVELRRGGDLEMHVFDAKLKVEGIVAVVDGDDDLEDEPSNALTFKREDVAKMHAYRDALPSVRSARVLYPGTVTRDFLSMVANPSPIDAIGVVPLVPGGAPFELRDVLHRILQRC